MHRIHDPIFGYIDLYEHERKLIDTLIFQRLRGIHQQGTAYLTYPSSKHDRFSHSLGVMKIATDFIHAYSMKGDALLRSEITPLMKRIVRIVCLCHDLGHGPYSHVSDRIFRLNLTDDDKNEMLKLNINSPHELFSCRIVRDYIPQYIDEIEEEYNQFSRSQRHEQHIPFDEFLEVFKLSGPRFFDKSPESPLLYLSDGSPRELPYWKAFKQIIDCDFDSDKIDYIQRDGYVTGVKAGHLDSLGLLNNIMIDFSPDGQDAAFARQAVSAIETLILERYKLFKWLNFHHTVCFSDELMSRIMELSSEDAFEEGAFTYETLKALVEEDLKSLKDDKYRPYGVNILDDYTVIHNVKTAFKDNKTDNINLARYYLNIIEMRQFFTGIWRVDTLLEPDQERILFNLKDLIDQEHEKYTPYQDSIIKVIENELATLFKKETRDVIVSYKPYEPVKSNIDIKVRIDDGFVNIRNISAIIALLEWRRRIRPTSIRNTVLDTINETDGEKFIEKVSTFLMEELDDAPQIFTPIYVYIKGFPREERENAKIRIFKKLDNYV